MVLFPWLNGYAQVFVVMNIIDVADAMVNLERMVAAVKGRDAQASPWQSWAAWRRSILATSALPRISTWWS
jgi:hypothetical protein